MVRSNLCDYSDACIVVKKTVDLLVAAAIENDKAQKNVAFKEILHLNHVFQKLTLH